MPKLSVTATRGKLTPCTFYTRKSSIHLDWARQVVEIGVCLQDLSQKLIM